MPVTQHSLVLEPLHSIADCLEVIGLAIKPTNAILHNLHTKLPRLLKSLTQLLHKRIVLHAALILPLLLLLLLLLRLQATDNLRIIKSQ